MSSTCAEVHWSVACSSRETAKPILPPPERDAYHPRNDPGCWLELKKREDIQGLRALALVLVIAFHIWPAALPGGFVGVDVFFVVSGYLISRHLLREHNETGTISVSAFWARRVRRLLPAAFVTLLGCQLTVFILLPVPSWRDNLAGIIASASYVQNWQLVASATDYLGGARQVTVVQHFWSLSVEEQFYPVWPLVLVTPAERAPRGLGDSVRAQHW